MQKEAILRKIQEVETLAEKFKNSKTIVAFEYKGLSVSDFTKLRNTLRKENVEVKVYKNNITRRAAQVVGFDDLVGGLVGPIAIAISYDDVVAPAKHVFEFAKENKTVVIKSGVIEGKVVDKSALISLASLPSRETLLTQLAAGLLMPVQQVAVGLHMLTEKENN